MAFQSPSPLSRGRPYLRQSIDDHYSNNIFQLHGSRTTDSHNMEQQDREYAEHLANLFEREHDQIATDHQLALELSRNRSASPPRDRELELALEMSQVRSRSPLRGQSPEHEVHAPPSPARQQSPGIFIAQDEQIEQGTEQRPVQELEQEEDPERRAGTCVVCYDAVTALDSVAIPCGHRMCYQHVRQIFNSSMTDETLFPPRCCGTHEVPVEAARAFLGRHFPIGFDARALEMQSTDRTYCNDPNCSTFIPPGQIVGDVAICPTCEVWTCTLCKHAGHIRGECPEVGSTVTLIDARHNKYSDNFIYYSGSGTPAARGPGRKKWMAEMYELPQHGRAEPRLQSHDVRFPFTRPTFDADIRSTDVAAATNSATSAGSPGETATAHDSKKDAFTAAQQKLRDVLGSEHSKPRSLFPCQTMATQATTIRTSSVGDYSSIKDKLQRTSFKPLPLHLAGVPNIYLTKAAPSTPMQSTTPMPSYATATRLGRATCRSLQPPLKPAPSVSKTSPFAPPTSTTSRPICERIMNAITRAGGADST